MVAPWRIRLPGGDLFSCSAAHTGSESQLYAALLNHGALPEASDALLSPTRICRFNRLFVSR
jgi:hypothetical protein